MTSLRVGAFEDVVQRFFEAAAAPALWPETLQELATACGATSAIAMPVCGFRPLGPVTSTAGGEFYHDFQTRWQAPEVNTRMQRSIALVNRGWRGIITENDAFNPEELARDPFQQEFIRPHGYWSYAGAVVASAPGLAVPISVERSAAQGPFLHDEIQLMNMLFSHLQAAGALALQVGMSSTIHVADALSAVGQPLALIGRDGRIVHMNARFERLVGDGLQIKAGRLASWQADVDQAITAAVAKAIANDGELREPLSPVVLTRQNGLRPLLAHVVPVSGAAHDILRMIGAIVILIDLEAAGSTPTTAVLEQAFGLTPAEARLAAQIAAGKTLADISRQHGSAHETLRSQLKAVFDKTGTGRQAELALLLSKVTPPADWTQLSSPVRVKPPARLPDNLSATPTGPRSHHRARPSPMPDQCQMAASLSPSTRIGVPRPLHLLFGKQGILA
jgi:DNA-binding CsgD family transcriptional regulator/PAS domain-containing protein